ncbi:hypothetical protein [Algihabitans sp.]
MALAETRSPSGSRDLEQGGSDPVRVRTLPGNSAELTLAGEQ